MNTYKICFRCEGVLQFAEITSDQIANFVISEEQEIQSLISNIIDDILISFVGLEERKILIMNILLLGMLNMFRYHVQMKMVM